MIIPKNPKDHEKPYDACNRPARSKDLNIIATCIDFN
jgi:hypothetical protein